MDAQPIPLLLVEDEPDLREALGEYLGACGFEVIFAGSAAEALSAAAHHPPRLILSDLSLPDRRGEVFLEEFHRQHPECQLYVHSGDSSFVPPPSLRACGLSQDHVFFKPTDLSGLVKKLHSELL